MPERAIMDQSIAVEEAVRNLTSSLNSEQLQNLLDLHKKGNLAELLDLIKKKPLFFDCLVNDQLLEEPVLDYVTDLEARCDIYRGICRVWRRSKATSKLNMALFAIFMVAPINELQSILEGLEESLRNNDPATVQQFFSDCQTIVLTAILECVFPRDKYPALAIKYYKPFTNATCISRCEERRVSITITDTPITRLDRLYIKFSPERCCC
jgi:hypothetical protein